MADGQPGVLLTATVIDAATRPTATVGEKRRRAAAEAERRRKESDVDH